jgi:stage II sporulation protein D
MKFLVFILFLILGQLSFGQEVRIGLLHSLKVNKLSFELHEGTYTLFGDTTDLGPLSTLTTEVSGSKVKITYNGITATYRKVVVVQDTVNSALKIKSVVPASKLHYYRDNFEITSNGSRLRIVNLVDMDNYLAGVIESEGGGGRHLEYYKVQALMSRTYVLKNEQRHVKDGFQLCDGVHCQAYHNMLQHTPTIHQAVKQTVGKVLVDQTNNLVASYFSANCGGQTCDASFVWNTSVHYVESFRDTFCIHTRQATWTKTVEKYKWQAFLREYGITESLYGNLIYNFTQDQRKAFYIHPSLGLPLRDLRIEFGLKSTYFSTELVGSSIVISGRGFGHGVGLCQEGAMNMAKFGYDYTQIARFYFHNVKIVDSNQDSFFNQKDRVN